jgi:hypothetical protein
MISTPSIPIVSQTSIPVISQPKISTPSIPIVSQTSIPAMGQPTIPILSPIVNQSMTSNVLGTRQNIQIGSTGVFNQGMGLNKGQYNFVVTNVIKPDAEVVVDFGSNIPSAYYTKVKVINGQRIPAGGDERFRNLVRKSDGRWVFKGVQRLYAADSIVFN